MFIYHFDFMSETWKKATFITPSRQSLGGKLDLFYSSKY